ncbi:MAG: hypothetical protein WBG62_04270, partial [Cyclobacteriaceae bacterium]
LVTVLAGCRDQEELPVDPADAPETLSLVSPRGHVLAANMTALKNDIRPDLTRISGDHDFDITDITYLETDKALAIQITYTMPEPGLTNTIILTNSVAGKGETNASACSYTLSCSGAPCCGLYGSIFPNGDISYYCGCSECTLEITPKTDCEK